MGTNLAIKQIESNIEKYAKKHGITIKLKVDNNYEGAGGETDKAWAKVLPHILTHHPKYKGKSYTAEIVGACQNLDNLNRNRKWKWKEHVAGKVGFPGNGNGMASFLKDAIKKVNPEDSSTNNSTETSSDGSTDGSAGAGGAAAELAAKAIEQTLIKLFELLSFVYASWKNGTTGTPNNVDVL